MGLFCSYKFILSFGLYKAIDNFLSLIMTIWVFESLSAIPVQKGYRKLSCYLHPIIRFLHFINFITDLISQWEKLERNAEELQKERSLKREMAALRDELLEIATKSTTLEADLEDRAQLELRIQEVKVCLFNNNSFIILSLS